MALTDIRIIEKSIGLYAIDIGGFPDSLSDLSNSNYLDPWENLYQYLRIDGGEIEQSHNKKRLQISVSSV